MQFNKTFLKYFYLIPTKMMNHVNLLTESRYLLLAEYKPWPKAWPKPNRWPSHKTSVWLRLCLGMRLSNRTTCFSGLIRKAEMILMTPPLIYFYLQLILLSTFLVFYCPTSNNLFFLNIVSFQYYSLYFLLLHSLLQKLFRSDAVIISITVDF